MAVITTNISYETAEHKQDKFALKFNDQTTMDEIHQYVRQELGKYAQKPFVIQFMHRRTKQRINLNQVILDSEDNPYKNLPTSEDPLENMFDNFVELYVIDYFQDNDEIFQEQINPIDSKIPAFQFSQVLTEDIFESLCEEERLGDNNINRDISASNAEDFSSTLPNDLLSDDIETDDDNNIGEGPHPVQNNSPTISVNSSVQPGSNDVDRPYFTRDVNPIQKGRYRSDRFNQRDATKKNGYISHIQGIKAGKKAKASVLPRFHIPMKYRNKPNIRLRMHAVHQELLNGNMRWIKHPDKNFLPQAGDRNTLSTNPITLALHTMKPTKEGDFKLYLKMLDSWDKSDEAKTQMEVCQLDEESAKRLHSVMNLDTEKYDPKTPRLLGMIEENGVILPDTAFLSDFIRSTRDEKRAKSTTVNN